MSALNTLDPRNIPFIETAEDVSHLFATSTITFINNKNTLAMKHRTRKKKRKKKNKWKKQQQQQNLLTWKYHCWIHPYQKTCNQILLFWKHPILKYPLQIDWISVSDSYPDPVQGILPSVFHWRSSRSTLKFEKRKEGVSVYRVRWSVRWS